VFNHLLDVHTGGLVLLVSQGPATPWSAALLSNVVTVGPGGMFATVQSAIDVTFGPPYVTSVETGSYPSFSVLGSAAGQVHAIADDSGPVSIDASAASVETALLAFGQVVELVGLDLEPSASVELAGLTPGGSSVAPGATLVTHGGVMPDIACGSFESLGVPFTIAFEAAPSTFYQLATGAGLIPVDRNDPNFWQMLLLVNFTSYTVV